MANGLPYGIGAAVAYPGRQVVCVVGDGGLTMLMGEIATLVKYKLPVKVIVIKNNELGQIKWEQMALDANPEFGIDLQPIDFAMHAQACGAAGFTIEDPKDAEDVLRQALAHPGPAVIQAVVDPNEPPLPGQHHAGAERAFRRSAGRATRSGRRSSRPSRKTKCAKSCSSSFSRPRRSGSGLFPAPQQRLEMLSTWQRSG